MFLTIRVAIAIFFSAFVLWSQTPDTDFRKLSVTGTTPELRTPSLPETGNLPSADRYTFKLNLYSGGAVPMSYSRNPLDSQSTMIAPEAKRFLWAGLMLPSAESASAQQRASRPKAVSLSNGYMVRRKIHKYASIATLPLFVSELIVGERLRDESSTDTESSSLRSAHSGLAAGLGVLFGVESVTGVWNMMEARKYPGHKKRFFHGILMLAADAGFVATAATAPHREDRLEGRNDDVSTHRALAYTSIGIATVSYVYMLIAK